MNIFVLDRVDRDECDVVEPTVFIEERKDCVFNLIESFLFPVHGSHLGNYCNQFDNTQSLS